MTQAAPCAALQALRGRAGARRRTNSHELSPRMDLRPRLEAEHQEGDGDAAWHMGFGVSTNLICAALELTCQLIAQRLQGRNTPPSHAAGAVTSTLGHSWLRPSAAWPRMSTQFATSTSSAATPPDVASSVRAPSPHLSDGLPQRHGRRPLRRHLREPVNLQYGHRTSSSKADGRPGSRPIF